VLPLLVLLVLVILQLALPPIATQILRGRVGDAKIQQVSLSAFPAIKLLWGDADNVTLTLSSDTVHAGKVNGMLGEAAGVNTIDARVARLNVGPLAMHDVSFQKRGARATVTLQIDERDLQAALPIIRSVTPIGSGHGQLTLRGTAGILGVNASVDMVLAARDGRIVLAPTGLIGALAAITVFSDPHLYVDAVSGHAIPGGIDVAVRANFR
jgi:hypothetical protein